jgi:Tol biopolymer transport system component
MWSAARRGTSLAVAVLLTLGTAQAASAQYFGRQKVQYDVFDWQILQTPHFRIHYYPESREATEDAGRMAERWYERLSRIFQHEFDEKPIVFYADHPDFQQTNVTPGMIGEGTQAFAESLRNRVVMPHTGVYADTDHILGHELVHVFQYELASTPGGGGVMGMGRLPLFLIEGMAEYLSVGRYDPHTAMWMRDAAVRGELPSIDQLARDTRFFPYRYGQALWAYIAGRWGDRAVPELYRLATRAGWEPAVQRVLGTTSEQISQDWITSIRATYLPLIEGRQRSADAGDPVIVDPDIGAMNLAPTISPDGRFMAFYGRRQLFTTDLYLADAVTGQVLRTLASPQQTPHFDALSFIASAGTWSPDGRQFAFVVFRQGNHELSILDVESANITRRFAVPGIGGIQHPAWSPDGRTIAFSGMAGGISDLYLLDVESGQTRQLTSDRYADLQPVWSPDGGTIAFVTDRGPGTDFDLLVYGPMQIGLIDVATRAVTTLGLFDGAKHINPQYSGDGGSLFFVSDREGFSDVYRHDLQTGETFQITRLATGVSGISTLSPAMSVSPTTGRMLFSIFENSGTNIYGIDADRTVGERVVDAPGARIAVPGFDMQPLAITPAGMLPPVEAAGIGVVAQYLDDPIGGLPSPEVEFEELPYRSRIALEYVGPPAFGAGVSQFGVGVSGGISLYFSDMLGDHTIGSVVQANGGLKDIGGIVQYNNASRRLNWGGVASHIPYLTGYSFLSTETLNGQPVRAINNVYERLFINQLQASARYPFSMTRRFELNGGLTRYGFDREIHRLYLVGNQAVADEIISVESPPSLHLFGTSAALVGDNSYFAFTGPVSGERFRFEYSPTVGTLNFQTALADYRRYIFMQPFTLAFRGMHYGRYGKDAEGIRETELPDGSVVRERLLSPLFLGWETLVRGYSQESFRVQECSPDPAAQGCPEFDRLVGTRVALASLEFRIPVFGVPEFGLLNFPYLPLEVSPFVDAGLAWTADESPVFAFERRSIERVPVFSTGVSARINILGYIVMEAYYAYPFQRPERGAHWGFHFAPGW